jgi:hypothetical protein
MVSAIFREICKIYATDRPAKLFQPRANPGIDPPLTQAGRRLTAPAKRPLLGLTVGDRAEQLPFFAGEPRRCRRSFTAAISVIRQAR